MLPGEIRRGFHNAHKRFHNVFSSSVGCYNGKSGDFRYKINMASSLPPQRKGRVPLYNRSNLEELQTKFDELHAQGVIARPEDINVTAEYVSPSFLVAKPSGGHRLVTAFTELGQFAKPQPSLIAKVDDVIRQLGQFKYIVKADLSQAYYQVPLDPSSYKYVGVSTPFRGVFVYTRTVMGMPGSESALEQLLSRVLGDLMVSGSVIKLADDLYIGGDSPSSLLKVWEEVLFILSENNLRLSPSKTICCPISTDVLGWVWKQGTLQASNHRLSTLSACDPPKTVKSLRSFIGAYKFLSKVLPKHSDMMSPLDKACAGLESKDIVNWSDDLLDAFKKAKDHLKHAKILTIPNKDDKLQVITDASATQAGMSSTLYVIRDGKPLLAGLFNARKTSSQAGWLACELEALGIAAGVKHFSPYIVQSSKVTDVLTDSKPCVQAYNKLCKGAFSASSRVTTFLSTISRFAVKVLHIPGASNVVSDFGSRHAIPCEGECQICKFVSELEVSVVRGVSVSDILSGRCPIPFTTRSSWLQIQRSCPDLKQVYGLLRDGRSVSKKRKGMTDIRRYLRSCRLSNQPNDGLIIVSQEELLGPTKQRIVVPRNVLDGLLTALHLQLSHPSKSQLKSVFNRAFYALDSEVSINNVSDSCHTCKSLQKVPSMFREQSTSVIPERVGSCFAADVIKREGQQILLVRENVTSYTDAVFIPSESAVSLKEGLMKVVSRLSPLVSIPLSIKVDGATGFQSLVNDPLLKSRNIVLIVGEPKFDNHNPIADKGISEFHGEICRLKPEGGSVSEIELSIAVANLNSRVRETGYSAIELWTSRDMITGGGLSLDFDNIIKNKVARRESHHFPSAKYKGRGKTSENIVNVEIGDLVYLVQDRIKTKGRNLYIVVELGENKICWVQKFVKNQLRAKKYMVRTCDLIKCPGEGGSKRNQVVGILPKSERECLVDQKSTLEGGGLHGLPSTNKPPGGGVESDSSGSEGNLIAFDITHNLRGAEGAESLQTTEPSGSDSVEEIDETPDLSLEAERPQPNLSESAGASSELTSDNPDLELRVRPKRRRKRPDYLADYVTDSE